MPVPSKPRPSQTRRQARPALEPLETRCVPAFGIGGIVLTSFGGTSSAGANTVLIQGDNKIVASGNSDGKFAVARYSPAGVLDTSFSGDGKQTANLGRSADSKAAALQPDGKVVSAGNAGYKDRADFALTRFKTDGSQDTTFGTKGMVTTDFFGRDDGIMDVAVRLDGKIVVAGGAQTSPGGYIFALARYNANGGLDTSFGAGGKVTTDLPSLSEGPRAMALQADGKIVVVGNRNGEGGAYLGPVLVRYNENGSLDTTFGAGGVRNLDHFEFGIAEGVAIQPDGKILILGYGYAACVARYDASGNLDATFGTNGVVTTLVAGKSLFYDAAVQPDGKIVTVGFYDSAGAPGGWRSLVIRYDDKGALDTTFNGTGMVLQTIANGFFDVAVQGDGKILAAGGDAGGNFALARFNADGSLDAGGAGGSAALTAKVTGTAAPPAPQQPPRPAAGLSDLVFTPAQQLGESQLDAALLAVLADSRRRTA